MHFPCFLWRASEIPFPGQANMENGSMSIHSSSITHSAPGRICLFGEHQDYLGLPVVAMAINLRFLITFMPVNRNDFLLYMPDINEEPVRFDPDSDEIPGPNDFLRGTLQVLKEEGFRFRQKGQIVFRSYIPEKAGCSSSSAMSAAWMRLLLEIGDHPEKEKYINNPEQMAYLLYRGEKEKLQGSGGMMDQYACYLGGTLYIYPEADRSADRVGSRENVSFPYNVDRIDFDPTGFILIDSGQPKDTQGVLSTLSIRAKEALAAVQKAWPEFELTGTSLAGYDAFCRRVSVKRYKQESTLAEPTEKQLQFIREHLINRDLCQDGYRMLKSKNTLNHEVFGQMLDEEHRILSHTFGISTPKIDSILEECRRIGALGGKINGSGGGGTCFVYCPHSARRQMVKDFLTSENLAHYQVRADSGAT